MPVQTWVYPWNDAKAQKMFSGTPWLLGLLASHFGKYPFSGQLDFEPAGGSPVTVVLEGYGATAPRIAVEPGVLLFGILAPGQKGQRELRLSNAGQDTQTISMISVEEPFSLAAPRMSQTLGPGGSLDLQVEVDTSQAGVASGRLRVASDDLETPVLIVPLRAVIRDGRTTGRVRRPVGLVRPGAAGSG